MFKVVWHDAISGYGSTKCNFKDQLEYLTSLYPKHIVFKRTKNGWVKA